MSVFFNVLMPSTTFSIYLLHVTVIVWSVTRSVVSHGKWFFFQNGSKWWLQIVTSFDICSVKFDLQRIHCCSRLRSLNLFSPTLREKSVLPKLHLIVSLILILNPSSVVSYVENDFKIILHTTFISICWKYRCNVETKWTCT